MSLVQKVTDPRNWIRAGAATIETNRHAIKGAKVDGAFSFEASRKDHRLHAGCLLGTYPDAGAARAVCERDYWQLPRDPLPPQDLLDRVFHAGFGSLSERHAARVWKKDRAEFERKMKVAVSARERAEAKKRQQTDKRAKKARRRVIGMES